MATAKRKSKTKAKSKETRSVVDPDRAKNYHVSDVRTPSGRKSVDSNDKIARKLRGLGQKELAKVAREAGLGDRYNQNWKHLNPGLCRMALGNALRHVGSGKGA